MYRRPGPPLKWQHLVYALQEMGFVVHVGGRSALDHQGMVHYVPMGERETIYLYSENQFPAWLHKVQTNAGFETHRRRLFSTGSRAVGSTDLPFGAWEWPLKYSTRERALLEYLDDLPDNADLDMADKYMEAATTFRPQLMMRLLQACTRIKTKRLTLWLAERHHHAWLDKLDISDLDLGSGKRVIYKGGVLDKRYHITIPREYVNGENTNGAGQPLF